MTVSDRRQLAKDLIVSLRGLGEECPSRVRHWLLELGERSLEAIEHVANPDHAVVHSLADDLRRTTQVHARRLTVFISGFPGLGKTTIAKQLCYELGPQQCSLVHIESYLMDRSYRQKQGLQGDEAAVYDLSRLDRDLSDLVSHGRTIRLPTKAAGDYSGFDLAVPARPIILIDGALDFIYRLHTEPDIVVFLDGAPLTRLCLSLLRDQGRLPGDRAYSLEDALRKWHHYDTEYYSSTAYIKNRMHVLLQTDLHHRHLVLRRSLSLGGAP